MARRMRTPHDTADSADTKPQDMRGAAGGDDIKVSEKRTESEAPGNAIAGDFASYPPEDGETINGRKPADINLVYQWCRIAHAPELSENDAKHISMLVNYLLFMQQQWRDEYATERAQNPSILRRQRIVVALATLRTDVPEMIAELKQGGGQGADQAETLLNAVRAYDGLIDVMNRPKSRGRNRSLESNVAANLSANMLKVWHGRGSKNAVNIFISEAMAWLTGRPVKPSENKIRKARTKRPKSR